MDKNEEFFDEKKDKVDINEKIIFRFAKQISIK